MDINWCYRQPEKDILYSITISASCGITGDPSLKPFILKGKAGTSPANHLILWKLGSHILCYNACVVVYLCVVCNMCVVCDMCCNMWVYGYVCPCILMWRPEADAGYLLSHTTFLTALRKHLSLNWKFILVLTWLAISMSPISMSPSAGVTGTDNHAWLLYMTLVFMLTQKCSYLLNHHPRTTLQLVTIK